MILDIHHADFHNIIPQDAQFERVASGFDFIEGPIWHPGEKTVIFSDILGNSLYRWSAKTGVQTLRRNSYMSNGNAYDQQGRIITCEHAASSLTRTDFANNGEREVLASHYQDKELNSPNDVVVKSDGAIYFTDPTSGRSAGYGVPRDPELTFSGVYRLDAATFELVLLVDDFSKPNGLCFSLDESQLYINDTDRQHIRVFDVQPNGTLANGRLFAELTGDAPGVADGMKIDQEGNLYSCGPGGIHVFNPDGLCLGVIPTPEFATNMVFGDEDLRTLYVTATTSLYRLSVKIPGQNIWRE
ncbi:MAG: SMP-30/gluconolactonase/LRE family protein [Anaerolineae bacterium]|nr:SMP-30/gluconolactonase/LRE family protein [Anaerolineae bacterium]